MPETCWKQIGTEGDGSCPRLAELAHCRNCTEYARAGRALLERGIPPADREEWTRRVAEKPVAAATDTAPVVVFRLGEEYFALPSGTFARVMEVRPIHVVPGRSRGAFLGLVNVDGELLLCCSVASLLDLPWKGKPRRMFVAELESARFVFPVEEVLGFRLVSRAALAPPPATLVHAPSTATTSLFELDGRQVALLDAGRLFDSAARSLG